MKFINEWTGEVRVFEMRVWSLKYNNWIDFDERSALNTLGGNPPVDDYVILPDAKPDDATFRVWRSGSWRTLLPHEED